MEPALITIFNPALVKVARVREVLEPAFAITSYGKFWFLASITDRILLDRSHLGVHCGSCSKWKKSLAPI